MKTILYEKYILLVNYVQKYVAEKSNEYFPYIASNLKQTINLTVNLVHLVKCIKCKKMQTFLETKICPLKIENDTFY